jgi:hypothetical protein
MKLESLKDFQLNIIEKEQMLNVYGGKGKEVSLQPADQGGPTGGGEVCASQTGISTSGSCVSYTSDWGGAGIATTLWGTSDTGKAC